MGLKTVQPFKAVYVGFSLLDLFFVRIPVWTIGNLLPSWRPRRTWSLGRCLNVNIVRFMSRLSGSVGGLKHNPTHRALELGKGVEGLYIDGVPELVTGDLKRWASVANVECTRIPGYWQNKPGAAVVMGSKPVEGEKILLAFHGGGYAILSAHPTSDVSVIPRMILARTKGTMRRSLSVEYRLAAPGENPFPAQLLDALAGYSYLVHSVGFKPEDIVIVGDSAGANLALALSRYLLTHSGTVDRLPAPPGGLILLSPWVDLSHTHATPGSSIYTNASSDFLSPPPLTGPDHGMINIAGPHGLPFIANEYISPASLKAHETSFKDFPRSIIVYGGAEVFVDSIQTLERRMVRDMGRERVSTYVAEDAIHDFIGFDFMEPERSDATNVIVKWIAGL